MKDFTFDTYKMLLQEFINFKYEFITVEDYFTQYISSAKKYVLMRHDVDRKPENSLKAAILENALGVKATYYFRTVKQTFKPEIISKIASLGHEIAYHYESLAQTNGDYEAAIKDFEKNLKMLRQIYPVKNIAMHGRPISKWDSRLLWGKYDYKDYGLLSEPYFDIDFSEVLYITDASRTWDNIEVNLRDRVNSGYNFYFTHTEDIIDALKSDLLPNVIMFNIHPEHWAANDIEWYKTYALRKGKNFIKRAIINR